MAEEFSRMALSEQLLFTKEAAEYLGISAQRLHQLIQTGQVSPIKQSPSGAVFLKNDLEVRRKELREGARKMPQGSLRADVENPDTREAINYFALQKVLQQSPRLADVTLEKLATKVDISMPFPENLGFVAAQLGITAAQLEESHKATAESFRLLDYKDAIVKRTSPLYPELLKRTEDAPRFLFMRGNTELLQNRIVSVVGTRIPSDVGVQRAQKLARLLVRYNVVVASGLARGIDTAAHTAVLDSMGTTIAVIGTPLNRVYPRENLKLQQRIAETGLLISQFSPALPTQNWHFPMRNAVMSGISLATAIIEAGESSGALKQADYAMKQGRLVLIAQSAIDNPSIEWPKKYLARGAFGFKTIDEVIDRLSKMNIIERTPPSDLSLFADKEVAVGGDSRPGSKQIKDVTG